MYPSCLRLERKALQSTHSVCVTTSLCLGAPSLWCQTTWTYLAQQSCLPPCLITMWCWHCCALSLASTWSLCCGPAMLTAGHALRSVCPPDSPRKTRQIIECEVSSPYIKLYWPTVEYRGQNNTCSIQSNSCKYILIYSLQYFLSNHQRKTTLLEDNHAGALYNYLISIQSGHRKNAGTTANVRVLFYWQETHCVYFRLDEYSPLSVSK